MADVRAMLRQERAARQQPSRPQKQSAAPAAAPTSKKRKAADDATEERKRTRTESSKGVPAGFFDGGEGMDDADVELLPNAPAPAQDDTPPAAKNPPPLQLNTGEEEDLDAFLKQMEEAPRQQSSLAAYTSGAVIESAPMTAAEIAAHARQEQSAQRGAREQELEAEKEDAALQMLDEFEEMDELEERVKKLRAKREALRSQHVQVPAEAAVRPEPPAADEEEEESDDEEWDDWRFRVA
ncbi:hypothetical protein BDV96DRAFT_685893 [Lophiotrema nucula]|uniref:Uncharacterized protein n=1 Tax=Lophiotrema nucula TaxID=690887 RepID=A0A6A5ZFX1_9PLEO|nr:hypothetical protein BDV96DRAFT_685893 [Lophiotrema nucula]